MTWDRFKFLVSSTAGFLISSPIFLYALFGLILLLAIAGFVSQCNSRRTEQKIERTKENITRQKIEAERANTEIREAEIRTDERLKDLEEIQTNTNYANTATNRLLEEKAKELYPR